MEEIQEELKKQQEIQKNIVALENLAKQFMTKEAISRYYTLKSVHPEKAVSALAFIAKIAQSQNIEKITDDDFKQMLLNMDQAKKEFRIKK